MLHTSQIDLSKATCGAVGAQCTVHVAGRSQYCTEANAQQCGAGDTCPPELSKLNFFIFSPSLPLNSGECRKSFVGLVTTNTTSQWRWGATVWEAN